MFGLAEIQIINIAAAYSKEDGATQRSAIDNHRLQRISSELQEHAEDQGMTFEQFVNQVSDQP
jgi:hypothetical protein